MTISYLLSYSGFIINTHYIHNMEGGSGGFQCINFSLPLYSLSRPLVNHVCFSYSFNILECLLTTSKEQRYKSKYKNRSEDVTADKKVVNKKQFLKKKIITTIYPKAPQNMKYAGSIGKYFPTYLKKRKNTC